MEHDSAIKSDGAGKMPVLFIGHGSPMNIILNNSYTRRLATLAKDLPTPRAIMVVSAHWLTNGTYFTCMDRPRTIYDFYGFPDELYQSGYPSPGSPEFARQASESITKASVGCNFDWGLDHAAWSPLRHMYPKANIPVFEMSLDFSFNEWHAKPLQYHYDLAKELAGLRSKGVLIIGSGNVVHNLRLVNFENMEGKPYDWAVEFDEKIKSNLISGNHKGLIEYQSMGKAASLAVPTLDHYLPMLYTIGLQEKDEPLTFIYEGIQNSSVSMRCFRIG